MRTIREDIKEIIKMGVKAPSGDNMQPWRFVVRKNTIHIYGSLSTNPEEVLSRSREALLITHGALIENMVLCANHLGYSAKVVLLPTTKTNIQMEQGTIYTASITLRKDSKISDPELYQYIESRGTDRNRYLRQPLTREQKKALENVPRELGIDADIAFVENQHVIRRLAQLVVVQIRLLFSHVFLHDEFFRIVRWSQRSVDTTRTGLDVKTLGINLISQLGTRLMLRYRMFMVVASIIGMKSWIVHQESLRYSHAGAYCGIILPKGDDRDWIISGRILERVWLVATKEGLAVQPSYATYLLKLMADVEPSLYSDSQLRLLNTSAREIDRMFNVVKSEKLMFLVRLGISTKKPKRSLRKNPDIIFE